MDCFIFCSKTNIVMASAEGRPALGEGLLANFKTPDLSLLFIVISEPRGLAVVLVENLTRTSRVKYNDNAAGFSASLPEDAID